MDVQFGIEDFSGIQTTLQTYSEPAHVDSVEYRLDRDNRSAVAVFQCEHYGDCIVTRQLTDSQVEISVSDLALMASLANSELERIITDSSWGAVFNVEQTSAAIEVPAGFTLEFRSVIN